MKYPYKQKDNGLNREGRLIDNQNVKDIESDMKELETRLDNQSTKETDLLEVIDARQDSNGIVKTSLKKRLDDFEKAQATSATNTQTSIDTIKANASTTSDIFTPTAKTRFVGHRGLNSGAPENTLVGVELAAKAGFWGTETDIQITSDGVWILSHDDTVDRVTDGTGTIRNMTLAQIKALTVDIGANLAYYPNLRVPTLEEYLQTCKRVNIIPIIEIKGSGYTSAHYDELVRIIKKWGFERKSIVICFTLSYLQSVRSRSPHICVQWLTPITQANIDSLKALGNAIINPDNSTVTPDNVELAHKNGLLVSTYTVNSFATAKTLIAAGVDFITSDNLVGGGQL